MNTKIALGMGNNVDYEIEWDSKVFEKLINEYDITEFDLGSVDKISSIRDLVISILTYISKGKGGEIYVENPDCIEAFSQFFRNKITLGGTSVRAAIAMSKLGHASTLHLVTMNDHVRELLPETSSVICSSEEDNLYPHLIVQYNQDNTIEANGIDITAARANRLIYVNDPENETMRISEDFQSEIKDADLLLISGFNAMQDKSLFTDRLKQIASMIDALPSGCKIVYEDACYHNSDFSRILHDILIDKIDIYSLNEDEMADYLGAEIDLLDPESIARALVKISSFITSEIIIVHTRYWALAYGHEAEQYRQALEGGVCMSNTRFRLGDNYTRADYEQTAAYPVEDEGAVFCQSIKEILGSQICCVPSFDIKTNKATTIGLGDSFVGGMLPQIPC